jgi:hypothetical protein
VGEEKRKKHFLFPTQEIVAKTPVLGIFKIKSISPGLASNHDSPDLCFLSS